MNLRTEGKTLLMLSAGFAVCFFLPVDVPRFQQAVLESLELVRWYAREHVVMCLIPAFFIAGALSVFISRESVMRYLGSRAHKVLAYGVASVSGTILAVCSCTVLPLFAGIRRMGAGLGPACTFLYSGPAINVLAIVLTARVLGFELGVARAVGAVVFSIVIGLAMELLFRRSEERAQAAQAEMPAPPPHRPLWQTATYFAAMVGILVFANWPAPAGRGDPPSRAGMQTSAMVEPSTGVGPAASVDPPSVAIPRPGATGISSVLHRYKWWITSVFGIALAVILIGWFKTPAWKVGLAVLVTGTTAWALRGSPFGPTAAVFVAVIALSWILNTSGGESEAWLDSTWAFAKQILPLLLIGVLFAGFFLGTPGKEGVIPSRWVRTLVGGNSLRANLFASVVGAFMYFATLTEIPILQGLLSGGMGKGPALALLLAGPALSLPNMLVVRTVLGTRKTIVYIALVVVLSTVAGMGFGAFAS